MTTQELNRDGDTVSEAGPSQAGGVVLAALMLATVVANFASVCMFPHVVTLSTEFGRPVNQVVWAIIAFHVIAVGVGGVAAALGAVFGNRRMLLVTLGLLLAGSLMAALSTDLTVLIAGRVLQGVGMAIQALAIGIIANYWRGDAMRRAISMIVLAIGLGAVTAYLASGFIWRAGGDWRTMFWILSGAIAIDLILTFILIKETKRTRVPIDFLGCIGLVVWALLLLVPLSQANSWGWGSGKVLGMLLPGLAVVGLWVWWELRRPAPLIDLRVLKRMGVWQGAVIWFVLSLTVCVPATTMPYLFQTTTASGFGFGQSIFVVSLALAITAVTMVVLSATAAPLMRRYGARRTMLLGAMFGLSGFGLAFAHGSIWITLVWLAAGGAVPAWAGSASYAVATEAVPPERGVIVSTICNTSGAIGAAVATAVVGYILTLRQITIPVEGAGGTVSMTFPAEETLIWSAMLVGVAALVNIFCVLTIKARQPQEAGRVSEIAPLVLESEV